MKTFSARIGLIGCGSWGQNILRDLKALGCHVSVVTRSEKNQQCAVALGADEIYATLESLTNMQGLVVATPASIHADTLKKLVRFNVPVFVEKPLTDNYKSALEIVDLMAERLFIMDKWRYHPGIEALAIIAAEEKLGAVVGLNLVRVGWGRPHPDVDGIWTLLPHDLAITLEILGNIPNPKAAVAMCWQDQATGLKAILGEKPWVSIEVGTTHSLTCRATRLECLEGVAVLSDSYSDHIEIYERKFWQNNPKWNKKDNPPPRLIPISKEMPLLKELQNFIEYLNGGPAPKSNAQTGLEIVKIITQLRQLAGLPEENYENISHCHYSYA